MSDHSMLDSAIAEGNSGQLQNLLDQGQITEREIWNHLIGWTTESNIDHVEMTLNDDLRQSLIDYLNDDRSVMDDHGERPPGLAILRSRLIDSPLLFTRFIRDFGVIVEQMEMQESLFKTEKLKWCHEPFFRLKREKEVDVRVGNVTYRLMLGAPRAAFSDFVPEPLQSFAEKYPGHLFSILSEEGVPVMATAITTAEMPWDEVVHPLTYMDGCRAPDDLPVEIPLGISQLVREHSPAVSIAIQNPPESIPEIFDLLDFCSHFAAMVMLQGEHVWSKIVNVFQRVGEPVPFR